jgi:ribonuclease HII
MKKKALKTASLSHEHRLTAQGYHIIAGIDEAGRGAWAGPVVAGAVCLPLERDDLSILLEGVRDSKQLSPRARVGLIDRIHNTALTWGIGAANHNEIDQLGIVPATCLAMQRALDDAVERAPNIQPDFLLLDSIRWLNLKRPHLALLRGDQLSLSIAAASVLAKVFRDTHMVELDAIYPEYGFAVHKGYGTSQHQAALKVHGASPIHRMSYAPLRQPADKHLW